MPSMVSSERILFRRNARAAIFNEAKMRMGRRSLKDEG
jgi:hypothetical protein